jgi:hypothetical protein
MDMKLAHSLLLGAAIGLTPIGGVEAADLPNKAAAPAADYVKVCRTGGVAGFVIPGSDTCLRISGYVSAGIAVGGLSGANWASAGAAPSAARRSDDFGYFTRGLINLDAVTDTAEGPFLAHVELQGNSGGKSFDWASGAPATNAAYVQWDGFTVGRHKSFFWSSP